MTQLQKNLGFFQGLAFYVAAVLGTGVLVIPLYAYRVAGPGALLSWLVLSALGLALAWTFAYASAQKPNAGGIQSMISDVFGKAMGDVTSWLVFFSTPAGATAAAHIFADHLSAAFGISAELAPWIAWSGVTLITLLNVLGIRVSASVQLILSSALVLLLFLLIGFSFSSVSFENLSPFWPENLSGIGHAAVLIFWSFLGWEAISHLSEEFRNPKVDMLRSALVAGVLVGLLYFMVAFVLTASGNLSTQSTLTRAPLVLVAQNSMGDAGRMMIGVMASVICLGTMNVYLAGLSRLGYAMAKGGAFFSWLGVLNHKTSTPVRSVLFLYGMYTVALLAQALFEIPMRYFFLIPNVAFLLLYTLGCLSVARIFQGRKVVTFPAYFTALVCALMIPFATEILWIPFLIMMAALAFRALNKGRKR